jgi:hypothetical protein
VVGKIVGMLIEAGAWVEYKQEELVAIGTCKDHSSVEVQYVSLRSTDNYDDQKRKAIELVRETGEVSISMLQRQLMIGYSKASELIEDLQAEKVISEPDEYGKREVLSAEAWEPTNPDPEDTLPLPLKEPESEPVTETEQAVEVQETRTESPVEISPADVAVSTEL